MNLPMWLLAGAFGLFLVGLLAVRSSLRPQPIRVRVYRRRRVR